MAELSHLRNSKFSVKALGTAVVLITMLLCSGLYAQSTFNVAFNYTVHNNWLDYGGGAGLSVHPVDSGYVVFGGHISNGNFTKPFTFQFNAQGQFQSHVELYDSTTTEPNSFHLGFGRHRAVGDTSTPHLVFLSQWYPNNYDTSVVRVAKLNSIGDTLWTKDVIDTAYAAVHASIRTTENGLAGVGFIGLQSGATGLFLLCDSTGNTLEVKTYVGITEIANITQSTTGQYLISGYEFSTSGDPNIVILTDNQGNEIWREDFGGHFSSGSWHVPAIFKLDGNVIIASTWHDPNDGPLGPKSIIIKKLNLNGDEIWQNTYFTQPVSASTMDLIELWNGDLLMLGVLNSAITPRAFIARFDSNGNLIWKREHTHYQSSANFTFPRDLALCPDGGYVVTGDVQQGSTDPNPGLQMTWLLKTDSLGCVVPGCHLVGIEEQKNEALQVFPNPFTNEIFVEAIVERVELYDMTGRLVRSVDSNRLTGLEDLPPALYIVKAGNLFARVIKE